MILAWFTIDYNFGTRHVQIDADMIDVAFAMVPMCSFFIKATEN